MAVGLARKYRPEPITGLYLNGNRLSRVPDLPRFTEIQDLYLENNRSKLMALTFGAEEHLSERSSFMPDGMPLAKKRKAPAALEETDTLKVARINLRRKQQ
jgi:hypothetical protein